MDEIVSYLENRLKELTDKYATEGFPSHYVENYRNRISEVYNILQYVKSIKDAQ